MNLEAGIRDALASRGPLTGAELHEHVGGTLFAVWKACALSDHVAMRHVGRRYVRMDRHVDGFARLSPSILREFLTYTVVAMAGDDRLDRAANRLAARIRVISRNKRRMAVRIVSEALAPLLDSDMAEHFCALIAGDIVYEMAHDVMRRESSTGGVVAGSDLDIVILTSDDAPTGLTEALDSAMLKRKWLYLKNPVFQEEVDYVIKPFAKLAEQASFETFPHMVACKVFDEAELLVGSSALHQRGLSLLTERGVIDCLRAAERAAIAARASREEYLLHVPGDVLPPLDSTKFYTDDEAAEFEH